jgi:hypothetical protein
MLYHLTLGAAVAGFELAQPTFREMTPVRQKTRPDQELKLRPEASSGLKSCLALARAPDSHQHFVSGQQDKMALNPATKLIGSDVCKLLHHVRLVPYRNGASSFEHRVRES